MTANRKLWFFRLANGGNQCVPYETDDKAQAIATLRRDFGNVAIDAVRRELTFQEYCGLLACNIRGEHGMKVYAAMQDIFFRFDPRS